jgi:hypothetical protein
MAAFIDAQGQQQQLKLDVTMYKQAGEMGMNLPQFLATQFPTNPEKYGSTFEQLLASEGIVLKPNRDFGMRPSTLAEILEGRPSLDGSVTVKDAVPTSRILFPAVILAAVENKLVEDMTQTQNALDDMIGIEESINGDRYEWPVLDFSKPEQGRSQRIAQLAMPASMMTITVSETSKRIPAYSLGLEVSEQALKATSIDFVALSVARQAMVEKNARANEALLAIWNGDLDSGDGSLASLSQVKTAASYDATITTAGTLTQKAWVKFLMDGALKKTVSHVVCDVDTALAIEKRTGRPVVTGDNGTSPRIDTLEQIANPLWPTNVKLFLTVTSDWPTNTIMAIDKRYSLRRVTSLTASYNAIESYVMRRSTAMRFDFGWEIHRMFDEATTGLTLTV